MTTDQKLKLLAEWQASHDQIEDRFSELGKMFNDVTGPLFDASWSTFQSYTNAVAELLGDHFRNLDWYWMENYFGRKGMEAGVKGDMRKITDFESLLWLIEVCE
jgi:hypothetical protein